MLQYDEMKILTVHNKYKQRGGEDEVQEEEQLLLQSKGHQVRQVTFDNSGINKLTAIRIGLSTPWSQASYRLVTASIKAWRPDVVTVHNFFPLASPSVHYAAFRMGIPVVQTLHNYRILCPGALLSRNSAPCEDCLHSWLPWRGILHRCYRGSALQTSAVSLMIAVHRTLRTWERTVSQFIAVSEFEKQKFVQGGFSERKIIVKPNFVLNSGNPGTGGGEFVFVGRLTLEKGVRTLLAAMALTDSEAKLAIVGDGPLEPEVRSAAAKDPRIRYLGRIPQREVLELVGSAASLIFPSEWYETFGRVAVEAFARGTPVIAARIGAVAEIVEDGRTGLQFTPGDPQDLAQKITWVRAHPQHMAHMRIAARQEFEMKYTAERNYGLLMEAYESAIASRRQPTFKGYEGSLQEWS